MPLSLRTKGFSIAVHSGTSDIIIIHFQGKQLPECTVLSGTAK